MSIKDNLKIANPKASDKEIAEKCKQCALDEVVFSNLLYRVMDEILSFIVQTARRFI